MEEYSGDIVHLKKDTRYNDEIFYGYMLILKANPFYELLIDAIDRYIADINDQKYSQ
ncbi:hypothetical protein [Pedobacter zeae]|uniref:Uncharacterized protein n=1 Tax=Pedobacter zeae TaxID=1737356 RepID=A0A7W6K8M5_9SPHI|nr:hypothetical protein [Pedobacter zeae]MBB4107189.1 hypothetical protein [Pedobacter zeae]GGH06266.1 hypothetical protein GCM10007422_22870 [Pedobacter zeae]